MLDELSSMWGKLSLTETEKTVIAIQVEDVAETTRRGGLCLVGKVLSTRVVGGEILRSTLLRAWHLLKSVSFKTMNDNLFLIEFDVEEDLERVLTGGPWLFDNYLVAMQKFDGSIPPDQLDFSTTTLWVQIHGLPLVCMNKEVGKKNWSFNGCRGGAGCGGRRSWVGVLPSNPCCS